MAAQSPTSLELKRSVNATAFIGSSRQEEAAAGFPEADS